MLLRGSNAGAPSLPGRRWVSYSSDSGWHWSTPQPWTCTDGRPLFSPSACSQLLRHSNGKLYWLGHLTASNPRGNRHRYPVVLGEVDGASGLLILQNIIPIDDHEAGEDEAMMLYPPYAYEDQRTGEVAIHLSRILAF